MLGILLGDVEVLNESLKGLGGDDLDVDGLAHGEVVDLVVGHHLLLLDLLVELV